jgi:hypothetical protein
MLREIKKPNRDHAQRVMQCLVVAVRPLLVEELAEVLAVDFDDAEGVPELKPNWRWEDQEQALLASCSSLIIIVDTGDSRVVQFSHYSVKEFLTSGRLATSSQEVSRYHIALEPAHTILAQACVSVLLRLPDRDEQEHDDEQNDGDEEDDSDESEAFEGKDVIVNNAPLAKYAAEYWVRHAQVEDVASRIKGMEYLFDSEKPYFEAWLLLHDIDYDAYDSVFPGIVFSWGYIKRAPLYYAALCGFRNLVEQLIIKYPQHVNAICGRFGTPALAALGGRHFELAQVLHRSGSSVDPRDNDGDSPLSNAVFDEHLEMVQVLLDYGVEVNFRSNRGDTPLAFAARGRFNDPRIVQLLLDRGADPNVQTQIDGRTSTPLHRASGDGRIEIARLLLEHGASLDVQDEEGMTPLDVASGERCDEMIKLLLEHRAK